MQAKMESRIPGPRSSAHAVGPCPIGRAADLVGDRWTLLVLREATIGVRRFDEFRARLGIADNILSSRLRRLVEHGVLTKLPYQDGRRERFEYGLTQAGADLAPVLQALAGWGEEYTTPAQPRQPMRVVHLVCGGHIGPDQTCSTCAAFVPRQELGWIRPWHSDEPTPLAAPVSE
jgi:DNA-binding HxlR family transcriptional regulator